MKLRLEDKIALITGASRGQGEAEARLFASEGAKVLICDILDDIGQDLAKDGDILLGLASSGAHSNGFSLIRKLISQSRESILTKINGQNLGSLLLTPTKIYVNEILELSKVFEISAISHITGGGFYENIPRILNNDLKANINFIEKEWPAYELFNWIKSQGIKTILTLTESNLQQKPLSDNSLTNNHLPIINHFSPNIFNLKEHLSLKLLTL